MESAHLAIVRGCTVARNVATDSNRQSAGIDVGVANTTPPLPPSTQLRNNIFYLNRVATNPATELAQLFCGNCDSVGIDPEVIFTDIELLDHWADPPANTNIGGDPAFPGFSCDFHERFVRRSRLFT